MIFVLSYAIQMQIIISLLSLSYVITSVSVIIFKNIIFEKMALMLSSCGFQPNFF